MNKIMKIIFRSNKSILIILILIMFIGAFFRFYNIRDYMTFLGDEGRDMLVVKRMLVDKKFTLLGPITSVGSMYMGPIYYYLIAPFLWIWGFDPVGPSVMVALFSIASIFLLYIIGSRYFHPVIGLISALLYAISPLSIMYGRSSWNPNIVPFFSGLLIFSLLEVLVKKKYCYLFLSGLCLGILFQLHYVTFMFPLIICAIFLWNRPKLPVKSSVSALIAFLIFYSPFLLFEVRHGLVNTNAVWNFFWQQKSESGAINLNLFWNVMSDVFVRLFWRLIVVENAELTKAFIFLIFITLTFILPKIKSKARLDNKALSIVILWLIVGTVAFGLYRGVIYDYYFGSLWFAPFLISAICIYILWQFSTVTKFLTTLIFLLLVFFNLTHSPLKTPPANLLKNAESIAKFVFEKTDDKPYNFALIAGKNSDHAYRYFFEIWGNSPTMIEPEAVDPERKTVTDRLFIICEEKQCSPLGHPLWEIAGFGRADIVNTWDVITVKVFELKHFQQESEIDTKI